MDPSTELLSPAGDFETALAAFEAGADAVYCGLTDFSARAFAKNLSLEDLEKLLAYAHAGTRPDRKVYVTFNTLLDEDATEGAIDTLARLENLRPDGLIVQDLGVARLVRKHFPHLALHASTQLVAHNLESVLALGELGFTRVVLARELPAEEIASIARRCGGIELESFIHGALCYSLSGLCLFGAMEKGRSGNRGQCPYCCRQGFTPQPSDLKPPTSPLYPFSMKDLRIGEDVAKLVDAGVKSLKIEGRMKSPLYVASVTKYYREILDGVRRTVTYADLETVFSRRTTELYLNGKPSESVIDAESLGHLGTPIGTVKKVTRDREGRAWLRFHTARGLEKHDGLQFEALTDGGRHLGLGIVEMRPAISRHPVFEVNAGVDVEVLVTDEIADELRPGQRIFCSMSNAVKRRFPVPAFRPSDYAGGHVLDLAVTIAADGVRVTAHCDALPDGETVTAEIASPLAASNHPEKTPDALRKAFSRLGGTSYRLGRLAVEDAARRFVPISTLNDLRRDLVERMDDAIARAVEARAEAAKNDLPSFGDVTRTAAKRVKVRADQSVPSGEWDEVVVAVESDAMPEDLAPFVRDFPGKLRLALPVYTPEPAFNALRSAVKRLLRAGFDRWEASDLATLRMLRTLGLSDVTSDWTLYAFNAQALATLAERGVTRCVASPENDRENLQYLAESSFDVEFLAQQSTPLFISLTEPASKELGKDLCVFRRGRLWITTKSAPRTFTPPDGVSLRYDLSWDPPL